MGTIGKDGIIGNRKFAFLEKVEERLPYLRGGPAHEAIILAKRIKAAHWPQKQVPESGVRDLQSLLFVNAGMAPMKDYLADFLNLSFPIIRRQQLER